MLARLSFTIFRRSTIRVTTPCAHHPHANHESCRQNKRPCHAHIDPCRSCKVPFLEEIVVACALFAATILTPETSTLLGIGGTIRPRCFRARCELRGSYCAWRCIGTRARVFLSASSGLSLGTLRSPHGPAVLFISRL